MSKPILITRGLGRAKIYSVPSGRKKRWEIRVRRGKGQIVRVKVSDLTRAKLIANQLATELHNGVTAPCRRTPRENLEHEQAIELLKPTGKTILQVAYEEVARWKIESKLRLADSPRVADVVSEFLAEKRRQNLSGYHLRDLKTHLDKFAGAFQLPVNRITHEELSKWLNSLGVGARTWNNYRAALVGFFGFAKERKFLPADWSELVSVKAIGLVDADPVIYTPKEFRKIIEAATPDKFKMLLAICAFAGIRSEEVCKLQWEDFDWEAGYIFLRRKIVKGKAAQKKQRQVPIAPNLAEWLVPYRSCTGPVCPYKNPKVVAGMKTKLAVKLGLHWAKNGLRKSWISYQLAATQDAGKVARWAGNSPSVIAASYERLVTPEAAAEWFSIRPPQAVLPLWEKIAKPEFR